MDARQISSVAYKKSSWMRYLLWGLGVICIVILAVVFSDMMTKEISAAVPEGYKFAVTNNYAEGSNLRTTYYVYEKKIFVEDESFDGDAVNRTVMIYDDINTDMLEYNEEDMIEICEYGACYSRPKVLTVIKRLISRRLGREYLGL